MSFAPPSLPTGPLVRAARLGTSRPRLALALTFLVTAAAAVFGASVAGSLSSGGITDPASASSRAAVLLRARFHQGLPNFVLLVRCPAGADAPTARVAGVVLTVELAGQPHVVDVVSYWVAPASDRARLESRDGHYALVAATVLGNDNEVPSRARALAAKFAGRRFGLTVQAGGQAVVAYQLDDQVSHDLTTAEEVAVPLTLVALVLVFGSPVAAVLPLAMGLVSLSGALAVLRILTYLTPVSVYGLNLTTAMSLGLGIDYSLFILSRDREELATGRPVPAAVHAAVATAGRTVVFSASAVGLSLVSLLLFPFYLLRSFAYAGVSVVVIAAVSAIVVLPALLRLLGTAVNAADVRAASRRALRLARPGPSPGGGPGFWHRLAATVMRHPVAYGGAVVAVLAVLGVPFLSARFGFPDYRVLPAAASSHRVGDALRARFSQDDTASLTVVLEDLPTAVGGGPGGSHGASSAVGGSRPELALYASRLSLLRGADEVVSPVGTYRAGRRSAATSTPVVDGSTYFTVVDDDGPYSAAGARLVAAVRATPVPSPALVTGLAAENVDALAAIDGTLPWALALVGLATFFVLLFFSGGLLVPLKALALNALSLSATFGAMVWVFQDGHLGWLLGPLHATGYLEAVMPVLMFCIAFGVSMDYEVFLVSRVKEEWDASDRSAEANTRAVATGLERTAPVVTAAAALLFIVFAAFATSEVNFIKMFGTGLALAVLMDAALVRGILVPAVMRLAGRANWWAPSWLWPVHRRARPSRQKPVPQRLPYPPGPPSEGTNL